MWIRRLWQGNVISLKEAREARLTAEIKAIIKRMDLVIEDLRKWEQDPTNRRPPPGEKT